VTKRTKKDPEAIREVLTDPHIRDLQKAFTATYAERMRKHETSGREHLACHTHGMMDALAACLWRFGEHMSMLANDPNETDATAAKVFQAWVADVTASVAHEMGEIRTSARLARRDLEKEDQAEEVCIKCKRPRPEPEEWSGLYERVLVGLRKATDRTSLQTNAMVYAIMASGVGVAGLRSREMPPVVATCDDGTTINLPCECDYRYVDEAYDRYMTMSPTARKAAWQGLGRNYP
jgi:hypothetical protein